MITPYSLIGSKPWVLWTAVAAATGLCAWLSVHGAPLKGQEADTPTPLGIVSLELCLNTETANNIISYWEDSQLTGVARQDIYWDFPFILAYASAIAFTCSRLAEGNRGGWTKIPLALAWLQFIVAPLDMVENIGMLRMLDTGDLATSSILPIVTTACAGLKFAILIPALPFALAGLVASLRSAAASGRLNP